MVSEVAFGFERYTWIAYHEDRVSDEALTRSRFSRQQYSESTATVPTVQLQYKQRPDSTATVQRQYSDSTAVEPVIVERFDLYSDSTATVT